MQALAHLRSFGRIHGRKLKAGKAALVETLLPKLLIAPAAPLDFSTPLHIEIGFGGGEHLAEQARLNPAIQFIGCEPFLNGVASLLASVEKHLLTNIRIVNGDARELLEKLPDNSVERFYVLFPDPWPKVRHHKRRLINQTMLSLLYAKLKPVGLLRIATDHVEYGEWILEQLLQFKRFEWKVESPGDCRIPPQDWVRTRYQAKAEAQGRDAVFLDYYKPEKA